MANATHTHVFTPGKSGTVATCHCGAFRHLNLAPDAIIVEQAAPTAHDLLVHVAQDAIGLIACNCSGPCDGSCTHGMAVRALALLNGDQS